MELNNQVTAKLLNKSDGNNIQTPSNRHNSSHKFFEVKKPEESNLTKQEEDLVINECATNSLRLSHDTERYTTFTCNTCKDKPKNICQWCYLNCHRHDGGKTTSGGEISTKLHRCSCAKSDHKIEEKQLEKTILRSSDDICPLNEFFYKLESKFYFFKTNYNENSSDDNMCIYCLNFCFVKKYPDFLDSFEELIYVKSKTEFNEENLPKCKCKNVRCHTNKIDNFKCISEMINNESQYSKFLNIFPLCNAFIQSDYVDFIEKPIREFHNKIKEAEDLTKLQSDPLTLAYLESLAVLESLAHLNYFHAENVNFARFNQSLEDLYSFEFLETLFRITPVINCSLLKVKLSCASLFRRIVLIGKPTFIAIRELGSRENFSPLHGIALKQNFTFIHKEVGVSSEKLIRFIKSMLNQAKEYNGKFEEENLYFELIAETIRWINYILSFKFEKEESLYSLIVDLADLIKMVKEKKKYEHILRFELEEVTVSIIYFFNEYVFEDYLKKIDSQNNSLEKEKEIIRMEFAYEKGNSIQKDIIRLFFGSDQQKVDQLTFSMGSPSVNMNIHSALFSNRDYFSESLKAILESNSEYINENFFRKIITNTIEDFNFNGKEILNEFYFEKFSSNLTKLSDLKNLHLHNQLNTNVFLNSVKIELENIITDLQTLLRPDDEHTLSKDEVINNKHKQIFVCKMGYINILVNFINVLTRNYIFKNFYTESSEVFINIIQIFKLLSKNNAFISCLFFNNFVPCILFQKNEYYNILMHFYYDLLINLKKENYKTSWSYISSIGSYLKEEINENKNEDNLKIYFKFFNEYFEILNTKLYEFACSIISATLDGIFYCNQHYFQNLKNYIKLEDPASKLVIKETIKLLNKLSNYYFFYMIGHNQVILENLEKIFENYDKLDSEEFYIFSKYIFRCNCEAPFTIEYNLDSKIYEDILTKVDANLIGRIINKNQDKVSEVTDKFECEDQFDENLMGMKTVLFVLKKFKSIITNFKNRGFLENIETKADKIDFYFKYFIELCLFPSIFSIYKIVYFSEQLNSELKYLIYILIVTFLQNLNFLCEELTRELSENQNPNIYEELKLVVRGRLNINNIEDVNMIQHFITLGNSAKADVQKINSPNFNQLDYHKVVQIFSSHLSLFKDVETIKNNDIGQFVMNKDVLRMKFQDDSFRLALQRVYFDYANSKTDFANSAVAEIFNSNDQYYYNSIKKNIAIEFLTHYREYNSISVMYGSDYNWFHRDHAIYLEILLKLFKHSPDIFQQIIMENAIMRNKIFHMMGRQVTYLYQIVVIEFVSLNKKDNLYAYENLLNLIEFGRLLAENHNQMFQTFLMRFRNHEMKATKYSLTFLQIILKVTMFIIKLIKHNNSKKNLTKFLKADSGTSHIYFNNLITYLHNFLIEIVQGTLSSNFDIISEDDVFITYVELTRDLFNEPEQDEYVFYLGKSLAFLNAYIEDINNQGQQPVKCFKAEKCSQVLLNNFRLLVYIGKHYYSNGSLVMKSSIDNFYDFYKLKFSSKTEEVKNFNVKDGDHMVVNELFISEFLDENNPYYVLAYQIFYMFKLVEMHPKFCTDGSFQRVFKNMKTLGLNSSKKSHPEEDSNADFDLITSTKSSSNEVLVKETFLFFNELVKSVEIITTRQNEISESDLFRYKEYFTRDLYMKKIYKKASKEILKLTSKNELVKVIFINKPSFRFLTEKDSHDFLEMAIKKEPSIRKYLMLEHVEERLAPIIEVRKKLWMQKSKLLNFIYNIDYSYHVRLSVLISLLTNIMLVFSMKYDNIDSPTLTPYDVNYAPVQNYISYLNTLHLAYIGPLIFSFISFKIFEDSKLNKSYNIFSALCTICSIINYETFILVWNFTCGCLASISTPFCFFYALQLFSMMSIFPIMKAAISSIFLRYGQFLSTALLLIIVCIFYGSICIFFLNSGMADGDSGKSTCETFWQCVLHIFNGGIRSGSLGFPVKAISATGYWQEFVVDWTFYLIVILILLNFVNGIIVDTFNELYEANLVKIETLQDTCFICDQKRSKFEVVGVDFEKHKFSDHLLLNYFYYIIRIKSENKHDLNALDSQVLESIVARRTDFIPVKKSWDMMHIGDDEEGHDESNKKDNYNDSKPKSDEDKAESECSLVEEEESEDDGERESSEILKNDEIEADKVEQIQQTINEEMHISSEEVKENSSENPKEKQVKREKDENDENEQI
jgi:hypothetical protein